MFGVSIKNNKAMKTGYYSTDPLKNEVISNIINSTTRAQFELAVFRAKEEGFDKDEIVIEWMDLRQKLYFKGETKF